MAAPTYESETTATGAAVGSLACNVPASTADDDLLLAYVFTAHATNNMSHTTPSGWTLVGTAAKTSGGNRSRISVYRKVASSEPSSHTFSFSITVDDVLISMARISGVDTTAPINASSVLYPGSASATPSSASVTTSVDDCLVLSFLSILVTATTIDAVPSGMTSEYDATTSGSIGTRSGCARVNQASAGSSGAKTWTISDARIYFASTIAVAPALAGNAVSIGAPVQYQMMQRDGSDQADIVISGTYTGTPTAIEASFNGGSYATIDGSPSAGTFSGTLSSQDAGTGTLTVRFTNDTGASATVSNVRIGDVFLWIGQSNQVGDLTNGQSFTGSVGCSVFDEGGSWINLGSNYQDPGASNYSVLPLLSSLIVDDTGYPCAFVCRTTGGTGMVSPDADWSEGGAEYNAAVAAVAASEVTSFAMILFYQGERDVSNSTAMATYYAAESAMLDALQGDDAALSGVQMISANIGEHPVNDPTDIQLAKIYNWNNDSDILPGPTAHDQDFSDDTHWRTDTEATTLAGRWWRTIKYHCFSGTEDPRGPRFSSATYAGDTITVNLTGGVTPIANGTDATGWAVTDNNGARTVSSVSISGLVATVTCDQSLSEPITVSYGDAEAAVGTTTVDGSSIKPMPIEPFVDKMVTPKRAGRSLMTMGVGG